ncbi:ParM/StbA family protein [Bacillus paranthracis]|uniref:ParM/StbA family protein n=1 Tax=Bacillus paranthracis TaxID=2026186 RepID=A0A5M9GHF0_9BACI|nr:ParM/StbA family protein [Bacillus paranthracis]KAA8473241.1 ParM/StbA family protein [Bacillus paranthracis]QPA42208.1 ParM/StbA family protein [Bacillus paranthracis]
MAEKNLVSEVKEVESVVEKKVVAEADLGNSNLKIFINDEYLSVPNVFQRVHGGVDSYEMDEQKNVINLLNDLHVHVTSEAIERNGSFFVGKRAMRNSEKMKSMNIKVANKHEEDLPVINTLSIIAANVIQSVYKETNSVPDLLKVELDLMTAIPASQHNPKTAEILSERFSSNTHVVIVYVGKKAVTVQIECSRVRVTKEALAALYAITEGPDEMFEEFQELYAERLNNEKITGKFFKNKKILHGDIGEGTSEYIFTDGLSPVLDSCSGARRGIGHAIEEACNLLNKERKTNFKRQQFTEIMLDKSDKYNEDATEFIYETRYEQAELIKEDLEQKFINDTGGRAEILAVYGGGSIALRNELFNKLKKFCETTGMMLLYVPEKYAIELNPKGMNVLRKIIG